MKYREFLEYVKSHPGSFETSDQKYKEFQDKVEIFLQEDKEFTTTDFDD